MADGYRKDSVLPTTSPSSPNYRRPSSLSSSFLHNFDSLNRLRSYFNYDDVPHPDAVHDFPAIDEGSARTRLEVLRGWEITFTTLSLYLVSALSFLYIVYVAHSYYVNRVSSATSYSGTERVLILFLNLLSFVLAAYYCLRLALGPDSVEHEQVSTALLLATGFLFCNPLTIDHPKVHPSIQLAIDSVYLFACCLYLFSAAHSYRLQDSTSLPLRFYLTKASFLLGYVVARAIAALASSISLPVIPFSLIVPYVLLLSSYRVSASLTTTVVVTLLLDSFMVLLLTKQVATTALVLTRVPYLKHRAKQLGFRCFVYQSLACANALLFLSFAAWLLIPKEILNNEYDTILPLHERYYYLRIEYITGGLPLALVYTMWTLIVAYVNLPPGPMFPWEFRLRILDGPWNVVIGHSPLLTHQRTSSIHEEFEHGDSGSDLGDQELGGAMRSSRSLWGLWTGHSHICPYRYSHREWATLINGKNTATDPRDSLRAQRQQRSPQLSNPELETEVSSIEMKPRSGYLSGSHPGRLLSPKLHQRETDYGSTHKSLYGTRRLLWRLGMKKNLLVLETQVMLMNAAYLSYLPGNPEEEFKHLEGYPSTSASAYTQNARESAGDDDALSAFQYPLRGDDLLLHHNYESVSEDSAGDGLAEGDGRRTDELTNLPRDNGTFFRINIARLTEEHGYNILAHFEDSETNAHAIILEGRDRVIVAFSGTRDVRNWSSNMQLGRETWNEKFAASPFAVPDVSEVKGQNLQALSEGGFAESSRQTKRHKKRSKHRRGRQTNKRTDDSDMGFALARELATYGQPKIHRGFAKAYGKLRFPVFDTLKRLFCDGEREGNCSLWNEEQEDSPVYQPSVEREAEGRCSSRETAGGKRLFFCGHSLGGAMAAYASYDACRNWRELGVTGRDDVACTTFGCPKVGNLAFQARYNSTVLMHWRFEIAGDPIVGMPTLLSYVPVGTQVLLDRSGELLIDPSFVERAWWASLWGVLNRYRLHFRASYVEALKCYARRFENGSDPLDDVFWPLPTSIQTKGLFSA